MDKKLVVIDGYSLLHRAFYALPPLTSQDGTPTGAVYGFLTMFYKIVSSAQPTHLAVAFDLKGPTFRHAQYEAYKAGRPPMPDDLRPQVPLLRQVLEAMGVAVCDSEGFEADDILGTWAARAAAQDVPAVLVTGDRDALQLASACTEVWLTKKGISELAVYTPEVLQAQYGRTPAGMIDLKGLMGDASDNIPGIPGVGEKTALKLLDQFGSLEDVLAHAGEAKGPKLRASLEMYADQARMSKALATIRTDVPLAQDWDDIGFTMPRGAALLALYDKLGFRSLKKWVAQDDGPPQNAEKTGALPTRERETVSDADALRARVAQLCQRERVAICLEQEQLTLCAPEGMETCVPLYNDLLGEGIDEESALRLLAPLAESDVPKVLYDAKGWIVRLRAHNIELKNASFDVMIAAYLLDATSSDYALTTLRGMYAPASGDTGAALLLALARAMRAQMVEEGLDELYESVELPLVQVLADMQQEGFRVDKAALEAIGAELGGKMDAYSAAITDLAGHSFNINSPKQLGVVLFEELGLPVVKKTRTGYSTDVDVLEQLQDKHPIIPNIIAYRQVSKLKNTYVDGLLPLIRPSDGKIHSTFNQVITATGRISSSEPNLQNIPVRSDLGRPLRKIFCAGGENRVLVDADYSQIELRVLAHFSQDEHLMDAFNHGEDIHRRTAAAMWNVSMDAVTDHMRTAAKAINFGIVYGISDFGLARNIGISRKEAASFIQRYLETYPGVKAYMDAVVARAKEEGYVATMFGRRRALPELASGNYNIRSFGQRVAMNMPIQGTAADIIKLAMVAVHRELAQRGFDAKLILQVHDELIVDAARSCADEVAACVRALMENAVHLDVPMVVDVGIGRTWFDAK
nr:DNA polymerase I [Maliibacterium massiliense]